MGPLAASPCSVPALSEEVLGGRMGPLQCQGGLGELSSAAPAPAAALHVVSSSLLLL